MSKGWSRTRLTEFCAQARLVPHEEHFVHAVLHLMNTTGVLSETALAVRTASFSVPWAESVLSAHRIGKLHAPHVRKALTSARVACDRLASLRLPLACAAGWLTSLRTAEQIGNFTIAPAINAARLDVDLHMREAVQVALGPTPISPDVVEVLAAEVAQGLISRAADPDEYLVRLRDLDTNDPWFRTNLVEALIFRERAHLVLVPVHGARQFESLSTVDPSVDIRQIHPGSHRALRGWGNAGHQARQFSERALDVRDGDAVLSIRVLASGPRGAANAARRTVVEVLDSYAASYHQVDFEVSPVLGVGIPGTSQVRAVSLRSPVEDIARPLSITWPAELREAIRMIHLARKQTNPMTQVSLAWVSLESAGVTTSVVEQVAKIVALALLRQRAFNSYRLVVQDALDRGREKVCRRRSETLPRMANERRRLAAKPGVPHPAAHELRVRAAAYDLLARWFTRLAHLHDETNTKRDAWLKVLESSLHAPVVDLHRNRAYLYSMSAWTRLLAEPWEMSATPAAQALRDLIDSGSAATRAAVTRFGTSAQNGIVGVRELTVDLDWAQSILTTLNTARNLHFHSGTFTAEGELALGQLAALLPDLMFEIWSSWYSMPTGTTLAPQDIVTCVAARYDACIDRLSNGAMLADADLYNLTGPNWSPSF